MHRLKIGTSTVDMDSLTIERAAGVFSVEPKVMDVLRALIDRAGGVVSRDDLIDSVWGVSHGGDERLSRAISILRRCLGDVQGKHDHIKTVSRRGYQLVAPLESFEPLAGAASAQGGQRGEPATLAVMPFLNLTEEPAIEMFALGLTEDIIESLSDGIDLNVKARSAVAPFLNDGTPDLTGLSEAFGVRYCLQGNVRRFAETVRVNTQLIDARSGDVLWSNRFEETAKHLNGLHDQLVSNISAQLRVQAHHHEITRVLIKSDNLTAREAVMRGLAALRRMTGPSLLQALEEAKLAISVDPTYGLAQALRAGIEGIIYNQTTPDDPAEANRIRTLAKEAIALDADDPALLPMAANALTAAGFPEEGLSAAKRAVQLNAKSWQGFQACGMAATLLDSCDEAVGYFDAQEQLAPSVGLSWISYDWRACAHIRAGRWDQAGEATETALRLTPDNAAPHIAKAVIEAEAGRQASGVDHMKRARLNEPEVPLALWELRFARAYRGNPVGETYRDHMRNLWEEGAPG